MDLMNTLIETKSAEISGKQVPKGNVKVSGAKNSATRLMAAALLTDESIELLNFPTELVDVVYKANFIKEIGGEVKLDHEAEIAIISAKNIRNKELENYYYPIRTTYLLVAGQIRKSGLARIPYPGGCKIGSRGYDLHIMVWEKLGCSVVEREEYIEISGQTFKGGRIAFPISTVGGTENALICASIALGKTEILNAYITPEIEDLIELLRRMGARIQVTGNSKIEVIGRKTLHGTSMRVMSDRVEAITWIVFAIISGGSITIDNVPFDVMESPLLHLEKAGIDLFRNKNSVYISPECLSSGVVQPFELACGSYPGIISDMQPFFVLLALVSEGISRVFDYRYPERISYVSELIKFCGRGKSLDTEKGKVTIMGPVELNGARTFSTDLRGSMALVLAAICASGKSVVEDVHMALRGYNKLEKKLEELGINISIKNKQNLQS